MVSIYLWHALTEFNQIFQRGFKNGHTVQGFDVALVYLDIDANGWRMQEVFYLRLVFRFPVEKVVARCEMGDQFVANKGFAQRASAEGTPQLDRNPWRGPARSDRRGPRNCQKDYRTRPEGSRTVFAGNT